jgi:hypothetical protein
VVIGAPPATRRQGRQVNAISGGKTLTATRNLESSVAVARAMSKEISMHLFFPDHVIDSQVAIALQTPRALA